MDPRRGRPDVAVVHARPSAGVVALLLAAIGAAQLADGITFLRMLRDHGIAAERNPLVAGIAGLGEPWLLIVLKVLLVLEVAGISAILARRHPFAAALVAGVGVGAGLLGAFSNVAVLLAR